MTPESLLASKARVASIHAGSTTTLSRGLLGGWTSGPGVGAVVARPRAPPTVRAISLLTGALPNVGATDGDAMGGTIRSLHQAGPAPGDSWVHTFGFGSDRGPEPLGELA